MKKTFGGTKKQWLFAIVPAVVLLEVVFQWLIPLGTPDDSDWARARDAVSAEKTPNDLVLIAPHFADQGLKYLADMMHFKDFGRFDITRYDRVFEVAAFGARAPEVEGMEPTSRLAFGKIDVRTYKLRKRALVIYDFRDHLGAADFTGVGPIAPKIMIDRQFHPRYAIPVALRRGRGVLTFKDVPLDGVIRGYSFLDYREARYDNGKPVSFTIYIDGRKVSEQRIDNFDGITPFQITSQNPRNGEVRFEITAADNRKREFGFTCDVRRSS